MIAGGFTTYFVQNNIINNFTNSRLKNSVFENSKLIEEELIGAETIVEDGKFLVQSYFNNSSQLQNQTYVNESLTKIAPLYDLPSKTFEDVCAYYVVLNPAYTSCTVDSEAGDGFFHIKGANGTFEDHAVTNVLKYDTKDDEHVVWWYSAAEEKKSLWIEPYFNANINMNMFSYVCPFFAENNDFLGVIGIDISLDKIIESINIINDYTDAYPILLKQDETIIYHKDVATIVDGRYVGSNKKVSELSGVESFKKSEDGAITYRYGGHRRTAMSLTLSNNLIFGISVRTGELRQPIRAVTFIPQIVYAGILVLFVFVSYFLIKRSIKPLQDLHGAVENVKKGDWKFDIQPKNDDEIGELTKSFSDMVGALAEKNRMISAMAFIDGLTGVKNKNAHRTMVERIDREIKEGKAKFAVVMLDVDKLKMINDNFGHDNGDKAIVGSCYSLCKAFSHSPVFRIGGDEFVAIVEGEDYEKRREFFEKLRNNEIKVREEKYDYSTGMATFEPGTDKSFNDVFSRADQEMYLNKKAKRKYE